MSVGRLLSVHGLLLVVLGERVALLTSGKAPFEKTLLGGDKLESSMLTGCAAVLFWFGRALTVKGRFCPSHRLLLPLPYDGEIPLYSFFLSQLGCAETGLGEGDQTSSLKS
jgi:hypothetical protein